MTDVAALPQVLNFEDQQATGAPTGWAASPAGTVFTLYKSDGVTPLIDTTGNSIPDTGPLAAGASYTVIVKAALPAGSTGGPFNATITATSETKSGSATVAVSKIPVASVVVSPATKALLVSQTVTLATTVKDSVGNVVTDRLVTWVSSNPAAATVASKSSSSPSSRSRSARWRAMPSRCSSSSLASGGATRRRCSSRAFTR